MSLFRSISLRAWSLIISSALLQIFLFPTGGPISPLRCAVGWFALTPFFAALLLPDAYGKPLRIAQAALLGYICGILWYLGNCFWIYQTMYLYGGLPKPVSFVILILFSLYLGLYHALFATLFSLTRRAFSFAGSALLLTPFTWVTVELARARITGFPWDLLGYSQVDNLLLTRIAPIAGVMSLSFVIAGVNAGLVCFLVLTGNKRLWIPACSAVLALLLETGTPFARHTFAEVTDQRATMLQENLAVGVMANEVEPLAPSDELRIFLQMSLHPQFADPSKPPTVVIWPEAPSELFSVNANFRKAISELALESNAPAIIGSLGVDQSSSSPKGYLLYDSASLFDASGVYQSRYDKVHLVPWGEYVPYKQFFAFAHKLTKGAGNMEPGTKRSVFTSDGHSYGVFICYESIFGDEVRHFVQNGAEVLVNISDDGWYGDTGAPWQHLAMARMRAIENHRWLLRSTNTGITTAIDPYGRLPVEAPRHVRAAYEFPFAFTRGLTLYTRFGDWFAWLCAGVTLGALARTVLQTRRNSTHGSLHSTAAGNLA